MSDVTQLNPLVFPLQGSRLIEASAGTGKTFTIALLYVRLVLGARSADDDAAFARPLTPPEILVVTFTNAATEELRDRIRSRLVEAAGVFLQAPEAAPSSLQSSEDTTSSLQAPEAAPSSLQSSEDTTRSAVDGLDPLLLQLRDDYPESSWPACARRLQLAAEWMDEAAVSTIHSWCYRMLREHAFDSGSLFSLNLETDQSELESEVVRDYWRCFYYPMNADELAIVTRYWASPEALHAQVRRLLPECAALPQGVLPPGQTLQQTQAAIDERLDELKAPWRQWVDELQELFEEAARNKAFKGQSFNSKSRTNWLGALRDWCQGEALRPALTPAAWKRLTPDGMAEIWLKGEPPDHPALVALAGLPAQLDALPAPRADLLTHAVHWCRERLDREQQHRAEMGPNELLSHLDRALAGANCEALGQQIRRQFPVAMVDEFQDTDPVQYRIFDCIYRIKENRPETGLLLIGDPKQAIYAFRGADIHTYLQARRDTAGRHVTLGTNFRSAAPMVEAVNRCFEFAEQHPPGAFLFKQADGGNPVPFQGVKAKGRKDAFTLDGAPCPALTLWQLDSDEPLSKTAYHSEMAERCASAMVALLEQGQRGRAGFVNSRGENGFDPVKPSDMAVLVNGLGEARAIRQALARRGVKSVYLSDKDKVFASPMAGQLDAWLRACAEPDDDRLLRTALAMPALGQDIAELDALNEDELAWEARVMQFRDYHRLWQRQGVLPLVRRLMNDFAVPARLLAGGPVSEGERWLTDLLHLGELLQQASQELDGEHALIRFLAESRANPDDQSDAHKLRLESDADLVQVITIHKSKGLEYPLVFLPFICSHRPTKASDSPLRWHDDEGRLHVGLEADEAILTVADRERLGEDLRKLYVALTRARHATWLGMAPLKGLEGSATGHLLAAGEPMAPGAFANALAALKGDCEAISLASAPPIEQRTVTPTASDAPIGDALIPARRAREHWWIASYSALRFSGEAVATPDFSFEVTSDAAALPEPATSLEATIFEVINEPHNDLRISLESPRLHRFPRGPSPGTFLHGLLEWAGHQGFSRIREHPAALQDTLARRCNLRGWTQWIPVLQEWLMTLVRTPLPLPEQSPSTALRLDALSVYQVELEFWFAAHQVDTQVLDDLVCRHTLDDTPRPRADRDRLNGMLKGFIDLVFEFEGRYYVADWKSNHLGPDDAAYTPEAMRQAVAEKRYDLQYALYLLALHRLLKSRLPDYDYDRHIGGSLSVFLRGTRAPSRGVHAERPPRELIEDLDALFQGATPLESDREAMA
ncbi:DNA helicase/exodeoxyribonuclease V, beta subunit [Modicisalibacter ilicicola DSM 19980]|uniref:RecBCD enzyme subunit RecB n=1 Tax=Modicisalibacter ilicicola DSM 19980 TaxID=1121942 RepID=A0A1M4TM11_9GAMM|nr:exodeoxyribonuclease V subunit beta [Halomonas ilicicola]SHE45523.1 DNA helicase/exodeoxyribonuclease V, beta subunit [Halomonas ilicicola DSM 19980]